MKAFLLDTVSGSGGGQVVLQVLESSLSSSGVGTVVIRKANLFSNLKLIREAIRNSSPQFEKSPTNHNPTVLVANANKTLPHVVILRLLLNAFSIKSTVIFIGHNYPRNVLRSLALRALSYFVDYTICVDPRLERNFFKTVPAPLLVSKGEVNRQTLDSDHTPRIVSYQRADKVKGGLRLPPIFEMLTSKGFKCEIALDSSIDGDTRYSDQLFREVAPWLVGERKDRMWLQHGDVFILSSFSEAAALSAQEAVYRGCYVVSSNVGIIHELSQKVPVIRVIDPWSTDSVCKEILEIASLSAVQRTQEIHVSQLELSSISGKWIEFVTTFVADFGKVKD